MSQPSLPAPPPRLNDAPSPASEPAEPSYAARLTEDLFLGAFLIAEGARLADTQLDGTTVAFVIEGDGAELTELVTAYRRGEAHTNVLRLKAALTHLKDVMFARLRDQGRRPEGPRPEGRRPERRDERNDPCPSPRAKSRG